MLLQTLYLWGFVLLYRSKQAIAEQETDCHYEVTKESGSIQSPGFPGKYPNNLECVWVITVPEGKFVMLQFEVFNVEAFRGKCIDMVEVKDGGKAEKELLHTFCNINLPLAPLFSSGNQIRVWFYSDASDRFTGFNASFVSYNETGCGGNLKSPKGIISSPRFGTISHYPSNITCEWIVTLDKEQYIKLWFEYVAVESTTVKCVDWIEVWDGPPHNETFIGRICQETYPIYSKTNRLRIKFVTNEEGRGPGFTARYTTSLTTGCGGDFEQNFGGPILSPNYPNSYPTMVECIWRIRAPPNQFVSIRFNEFIGMNGTTQTCPLANVEIRDGGKKDSKLLGKFCNYNPPVVVVSSGTVMWIRFQSSVTMTPGRFSASFLIHSRECNASLGMADGRIDDTQISASSHSNYYPGLSNQYQQLALLPRLGRLNGDYAWCSQRQGLRMMVGEYFQIDFRNLTKITAVATQGFVHQVATATGHVHVDYIVSYKVEFSYGSDYWVPYSDGNVNNTAKGYKEFFGIFGAYQNFFRPPIIANMIRVIPTNYYSAMGHMCLRLEAYGCPYDLGCGGTIPTRSSGKINLRGHSTKKTTCSWISRPSPPRHKDRVLVLTFQLFDIPCSSGSLIVKKQMSGESKTFCDNNAPSVFITRAYDQLLLRASLREGKANEGFDILYKTESLGCGNLIYVNKNGSISSPYFPNNYITDQTCIWILQTKSSARIELHFKMLEIQEPINSTCVDYVELKNGPSELSPTVYRQCANNVPLKYTSSGNYLRLEFISDFAITGRGFLVDYVYLPPAGENQLKDLSSRSGFADQGIPAVASLNTCWFTLFPLLSLALTLLLH